MDHRTFYEEYKSFLLSVAYKMLGSVKDAEDIVQDVFVQLEEMDISSLHDPKAYLTKMTTNKCLNLLQSARKKREVYPGPWLPEPIVETMVNEPLEQLLKEESISYAFVVLLHQLTELERCVFLLREILSYDYKSIAEILRRSEQSCRKVFSRAKRKLQENINAPKATKEEVHQLANLFLEAVDSGNFEPFIDQLSKDVVLLSDGGGKVLSAMYPIYDKHRVAAYIRGIHKRGTFDGELSLIHVNGEIGILQRRQGKPIKILTFHYTKNGIENIYVVMNPEKLNKIGHNYSF